MIITNNEQFTSSLVSALRDKAMADKGLQDCAVFAINQSIEHSNADCGIRLIQQMQEAKYGNLGAMVTYLCTFGCFAVEKNKLCFERKEELALLEDTDSAEWKAYAKKEVVEKPIDDKYIAAQVQALLKRAKAYAKKNEGKGASDATINALAALVQPVVVEA